MCFDFNKLIPMPESLNITCGGEQSIAIDSVIRELNKSNEIKFYGIKTLFSNNEYKEKLSIFGHTERELQLLGLKYISNQILHGHQTWYDWCIDNWDTKWNAYDNEQLDENTIIFSTAWGAPHKVIEKLAEVYPNAEIEHQWADEDIGHNSGRSSYKNGVCTERIYNDNCTNEAYETYIFCWGESECLYKDKDKNWKIYECGKDCDKCYP